MSKQYIIGRIYVVDTQFSTENLEKEELNWYKRMLAIKAPMYLAVKKFANKKVLFAPLKKEKIKKSVEIKINGEIYYAHCNIMPRASRGWFIESTIDEKFSEEIIDTIYQRYLLGLEQRKRKQKKREEKEEKKYSTLKASTKTYKSSSEKVPATVAWRMTHPLQGGRVSPR